MAICKASTQQLGKNMPFEMTLEFDFEFTKGQHHYHSGKSKAEKFQHLKKVKKAEEN